MTVAEASLNGTFKTLLILVVAWLVLRMFLRYQRAQQAPPVHRTNEPQRPAGEVRIERTDDNGGPNRSGGSIVDADFEEIK